MTRAATRAQLERELAEARRGLGRLAEASAATPTRDELLRRVAELEREQAAAAGVLRAVGQSSGDLQRVLDTICEGAARLCGVPDAQLWRGDASGHQRAAGYGPRFADETSVRWIPNDRTQVGGRAMIDRRTVHRADLLAEPDDEFAQSKRAAERLGPRGPRGPAAAAG